jgi:hypothetical protein
MSEGASEVVPVDGLEPGGEEFADFGEVGEVDEGAGGLDPFDPSYAENLQAEMEARDSALIERVEQLVQEARGEPVPVVVPESAAPILDGLGVPPEGRERAFEVASEVYAQLDPADPDREALALMAGAEAVSGELLTAGALANADAVVAYFERQDGVPVDKAALWAKAEELFPVLERERGFSQLTAVAALHDAKAELTGRKPVVSEQAAFERWATVRSAVAKLEADSVRPAPVDESKPAVDEFEAMERYLARRGGRAA